MVAVGRTLRIAAACQVAVGNPSQAAACPLADPVDTQEKGYCVKVFINVNERNSGTGTVTKSLSQSMNRI